MGSCESFGPPAQGVTVTWYIFFGHPWHNRDQSCQSLLFKKSELSQQKPGKLHLLIFLYMKELMKKTEFRLKPGEWHLWILIHNLKVGKKWKLWFCYLSPLPNLMNADKRAYQLSHLYDQLIQRVPSDDDVTKTWSDQQSQQLQKASCQDVRCHC